MDKESGYFPPSYMWDQYFSSNDSSNINYIKDKTGNKTDDNLTKESNLSGKFIVIRSGNSIKLIRKNKKNPIYK